jgi:hypothetical protein
VLDIGSSSIFVSSRAAQSNPGQTVLGVSTPTDPTVQARIQALTASLGASGLDTAKSYSKKVQLGSLATTRPVSKRRLPGRPFRYRGGLYGRRTHRDPSPGELLTRYPAPAEAKNLTRGRKPPSPSRRKSRVSGLSGGWAKGRRRPVQAAGERESNISALASGSLVANYGNSGSKGRYPYVPTMFMEVTGHFYPYLILFGASIAANSIGRMRDQLRNLWIFLSCRPLLEPIRYASSALSPAPGN